MRFLLLCFLLTGINTFAQFDQVDSEKNNSTDWDLLHYDLDVTINPNNYSISGFNQITFRANTVLESLVIGLQSPMIIDSIIQNQQQLKFVSQNRTHLIQLSSTVDQHQVAQIKVYYHGTPIIAKNAPWDGGFTWTKDQNGLDFIATANQGIGASVWWPCKEDDADEVDNGMDIHLSCPNHLLAVSNGILVSVLDLSNKYKKFHWRVVNPINAYGVCLNVADYKKYTNQFNGLNGSLVCDFYYLQSPQLNLNHLIKNVNQTLQAFEHWFGPFPFYEDSFKIIETPFLGMEHQSAIAYGNQFKNGYLGYPMGTSKWSLVFDYIIVHEVAHEWFANNITAANSNDLWIHESFATYAESLFIEYHYGKKAAFEYLHGLKGMVFNKKPILRNYSSNFDIEDSDVYSKGALMLHTLRQVVANEQLWHDMLLDLNKTYFHKTVTSNEIIKFVENKVNLKLAPIFNHYLTKSELPKLKLTQQGDDIIYYWINVSDDFKMPIVVKNKNKTINIIPTNSPNRIKGKLNKLQVDAKYYIDIEF